MSQFKNFTLVQGDQGPEFHGQMTVTEVGEHKALTLKNANQTEYTRVLGTVISLRGVETNILMLDFSKDESNLPEAGDVVAVKYRELSDGSLIFSRAYENRRVSAEEFGHKAALADANNPWSKKLKELKAKAPAKATK